MKKIIFLIQVVLFSAGLIAQNYNHLQEEVFENFNDPDSFLKKFKSYGYGIMDTTTGKFSKGNAYEGEYSLKVVYKLKAGTWGVAVKRIFEQPENFSFVKQIELYVKDNYNDNKNFRFFEIQLRSVSGSKWISKRFKLPQDKWKKIKISLTPDSWKLNGRETDNELFFNDLKSIKSIRFYLRNEAKTATKKEELFIDYIVFYKSNQAQKSGSVNTAYLNKINNNIKKIIGNKKFGVYVYTSTLARYFNRYNIVAEEMKRLEVDEVYLSVKIKDFKEKDIYKKEVKDFIYNLKKKNKKIKVYAIVAYGYKGFTKKGYLEDSVKTILRYNKKAAKEEKFDGFSFDIEPHIMKKGRGIDKDYPYRWGTYGAGKDNDMLIKDTLSLLKKARNITDNKTVISEALAHFFHDHYLKKDLSVGSINDFLRVANYVIIMDYSDNVKKLIRFVEKEINDAEKSDSIMVALKTKSNKMGNSDTTFWEEGINALDNAVKKIYLKFKEEKSFRGIAVFEYDSFIKLYKKL